MDFGYACTSTLVAECSPSHTVTVKRLEKIAERDVQLEICREIVRKNLANTLRLTWHNIAHGFRLYRLTSQLVPLATHPIAEGWNWQEEFREEFARVGAVMREHGMRISSHPGAYTVLGSLSAKVVEAAIADFVYHADIFDLMGLDRSRMTTHIGSAQGGKAEAMERWIANFHAMDEGVRRRLQIENDDTLFDPSDVLVIARETGAPVVLDIHHAWCNPGPVPLAGLLDRIWSTWPDGERPKIHVSSPRDEKNVKAHADFVDPDFVRPFLAMAKGADFDIMVEAKRKDEALLKLLDDLGIRLKPLRSLAPAESDVVS
jgi:UV DNA damage endonuclease